MKRIIITGATGMIGGIVLRECLNSNEVKSVTSLVRKSSGFSHPKLTEIVHQDFVDLSSVSQYFRNQDVAYYCLGVYTGQVPDDEFKKITVDYTRIFADLVYQNNPKITFCFLSGAGADPKEESKMSFARYKGMAENYLISKASGPLYLLRPAYIYPVEPRDEPNFSYRLMRKLYPLLKLVYPSGAITSEELAGAIFNLGFSENGSGVTILENKEIKQLT